MASIILWCFDSNIAGFSTNKTSQITWRINYGTYTVDLFGAQRNKMEHKVVSKLTLNKEGNFSPKHTEMSCARNF